MRRNAEAIERAAQKRQPAFDVAQGDCELPEFRALRVEFENAASDLIGFPFGRWRAERDRPRTARDGPGKS